MLMSASTLSTLNLINQILTFLFLWKYSNSDTEGSVSQVLLSLNKDLLRSLEGQEALPNPSVHLALRLSNYHNLVKETEHLNKLKTHVHSDIQK